MRTDEQQCLSMKTVLTVGLAWMTSEHATVNGKWQMASDIIERWKALA